jgi:hypothetical protein
MATKMQKFMENKISRLTAFKIGSVSHLDQAIEREKTMLD